MGQARLFVGILVAASLFGTASLKPAQAAVITTDLSGGSNWSSTVDVIANFWAIGGQVAPGPGIFPATAPYGNTATTSINPANMMWYCGTGSNCTFSGGNALGTGIERAFFGLSFNLPSAINGGLFQLIADDFITVFINGHFILDALLDDNQVSGQPNPLNIGVSGLDLSILSGTTRAVGDLTSVLRTGSNTIAIQAMDGFFGACTGTGITVTVTSGFFCETNRDFEYTYVQGSITSSVPEPGTLALFGTAVLGLGWLSRRRRA